MKKIKGFFDEKTAVVVCLAAGVALLAISFLSKSYGKNNVDVPVVPSDEIAVYSGMLESGLQSAVSCMTGSENVKVMVTLDSTFENVYVSDASINEAVTSDKTDIRSERQLVLTGSVGDDQMPVVVKRIPPKVKGAVIVCDGIIDNNLKSSIAAMAATALNIPETKIYVTGGY
ncbi:MAG: hypothetical protein E7656_00970 [Ruminococcaceae bacterium]|nr:hypothetical protein [Oscillospiraceae bacterium]